MRPVRWFAGACVAVVVAGCGDGAGDASHGAATPRAQGSSFVSTLRAGGNVIAFRHATTDQSHQDGAAFRYDQCARQRNLSPVARA